MRGEEGARKTRPPQLPTSSKPLERLASRTCSRCTRRRPMGPASRGPVHRRQGQSRPTPKPAKNGRRSVDVTHQRMDLELIWPPRGLAESYLDTPKELGLPAQASMTRCGGQEEAAPTKSMTAGTGGTRNATQQSTVAATAEIRCRRVRRRRRGR